MNSSELWPAGADATRLPWFYFAVWTLVAGALIVGHWRFWTRPAPTDSPDAPPERPARGAETLTPAA